MRTLAGLMALSLSLSLFGCGKSDTVTVETRDGKATVTTDGSGKTEGTFEGEGAKVHTQTDASGNFTAESTDKEGNKTTMNMGTSVDPSEIGIELFPGSTKPEGSPADSKIESDKDLTISVIRVTSDTPEKIAEFYKKLIKDAATFSSADGATIGGKTSSGDEVAVVVSRDKEKNLSTVAVTVHKKKK